MPGDRSHQSQKDKPYLTPLDGVPLVVKFIQTGSRMAVAGAKERENKELFIEFKSEKIKKKN